MKLPKNKFINIIFFSFTISIILFYTSKIEFSQKIESSIRNLLTDNEIAEICKEGKVSLNELYLKSTYDYESNYKNNKYAQYLIDYLDTNETKNLKDYIPRIIPLIIIFVLDIILIFSFFGYCICVSCCPCKNCQCCCYRNVKEFDCCTKFSFVISILLFFICLIVNFIGIEYGKRVSKGLNSTSCSMFKIYAHFIFGDDCNEFPKWPGFKDIKKIIQNTVVDVNVTKKYTNKVISEYNIVSQSNNKFENNFIENEYKNFAKSDYTSNIIVDGINNISKSVYFDLYYDLKKNLNYTYLDYQYLSKVVEVLKEIKDIAENIEKNNDIEVKLNESIEQLDDINGTFDDLSSSVLDDWYKYQKDYNKYSEKGIYIFFLILSIFPVLSIISLIVFISFCECSRFIFYFSWVLNMLIIIIFIIFGIIFGILGVIGKDGVDVMEYVISNENLQKMDDAIIIKGEGSKYLNKCFNEDGDLQTVLNLNSFDSSTSSLNDLYQKKDIVDNMSLYFNNFPGWLTELSVLESLNNIYNSNKGFQFYDSETNQKSNILEVLNKLRYYTDKEKNDSVKFYHWWTLPKFNCDENYQITSNPSSVSGRYCLNLLDFTECSTEYNNTSVDDNHNLCEIFLNYRNSIINFYNQYMEQIYTLDEIFEDYVESLALIKIHSNSGIIEGVKMIDPIYQIYNKLLGNNSNDIFSVLNCRFLKKDSHILFDVLNKDLGNNSRIISYIIFASCFTSAFGIFFGIIGILRKVRKEDKNNIKDDNKGKDNNGDNTKYEDRKNDSNQHLEQSEKNLTIENNNNVKLNDINEIEIKIDEENKANIE